MSEGTRRRPRVLVSLACAALFAGEALAAPYVSAVTPGLDPSPATYPGSFGAAPVLQWDTRLPGPRLNAGAHTEHTRPLLHDGLVYVGSAAGEALFALDRRSGHMVRAYPAAAPVESEPVIVGDRLYFTDTGGHTWCYGLDGTEIWHHDSAAPILVRPTVAGDAVFVTNVDDLVVALDAATGDLRWRYQQPPDVTRETELALYAAPPAVALDEEVLVGFSEGTLVSLSAAAGEVNWTARIGEGRYPDLVGEVTISDELFIVSAYFEPTVAIEREGRKVRWQLAQGAAAGGVLSTLGDDPVVILPGTDGVLRAVALRSGEVRWSWSSDTEGSLTQPQLTEAGVVVASSAGTVALLDPVTGTERWRFRPPFLLEGVTTAPAIDGRQAVFVTNAGRIYSVLAPRPKRPWPPPVERAFDARAKERSAAGPPRTR